MTVDSAITATPGHFSPAARDFLAGAVAGALSIATTQPLDTVRIRMQSAQVATVSGTATLTKPIPDMLACMVRKEGLMSPFRGMSFPLAFTSLQSALIFQVYGATLRWISHADSSSSSTSTSTSLRPEDSGSGCGIHSGSSPSRSSSSRSIDSSSSSSAIGSSTSAPLPTPWHGFVAGCTAGLAQVALWSPIEMLKIRLQLQTARRGTDAYNGPLRMLRHIMATDGIRGLYRGITVTAIRDMPSYGVYFASYRLIAGWCQPGIAPEDASALTQILAGGTAGCIAWMSIYPLDVIKSRMQADTVTSSNRSHTFMHYARVIYREGGSAALWRGIQPTLARAFVMDAVSFLGYTNMLRLLKDA